MGIIKLPIELPLKGSILVINGSTYVKLSLEIAVYLCSSRSLTIIGFLAILRTGLGRVRHTIRDAVTYNRSSTSHLTLAAVTAAATS